jgi:hypothetical protein
VNSPSTRFARSGQAPPVPPASPRSRIGWLRGLAVAGGVAFVAGLFVDAPRAWANLLLAVVFLAGLGLAGAVFVALHYVTGARWSTGIRRVPEAMVRVLPLAAAGMVLVVVGARWIYAWADPAAVEADAILHDRAGWMNLPFFAGRAALYFAVWIALSYAIVRRSRAQDDDGDPSHRAKNVATSAAFLVAFGITFSLASFDWLLSLEKHWFSTMFALYQFSGLFLSGLAAIALLVVHLRRRGVLAGAATDDVLHDLGKLLFGFSLFWGYIWFSQYMLIWYVNNPEETPYYLVRHSGGLTPLSAANVLLNWTIPFAVLLPREAKRKEAVLVRVAAVVLLGRFVDLYLTVLPAVFGPSSGFGPLEVLLPAGASAVFLLSFRRVFDRAPAVPLGEPALADAHAHPHPT